VARRFSPKANARCVFRQGSINSEYLMHLYELFNPLVLTAPSIYYIKDTKTGKIRSNLHFSTMALPCFNKYY